MRWMLVVVALGVAGCTTTSTTPMAKNVWQVDAESGGALFVGGNKETALKQAAELTIAQGYQRFIIADAATARDTRYIGNTGVTANTTFIGNTATTNISGGVPIYRPTASTSLTVVMFNPGDKGFDQAIDAQAFLAQLQQ